METFWDSLVSSVKGIFTNETEGARRTAEFEARERERIKWEQQSRHTLHGGQGSSPHDLQGINIQGRTDGVFQCRRLLGGGRPLDQQQRYQNSWPWATTERVEEQMNPGMWPRPGEQIQRTRSRQPTHQENAYERPNQRANIVVKNEALVSEWRWDQATSAIYSYEALDEWSIEYKAVKKTFRSTAKPTMFIQSIDKVHNPYTLAIYSMKKLECPQLEELELFHGTPLKHVDSICQMNFNYRLCGKGIGIRYGKGVSFAKFSYYATHYCGDTEEKVMFLCKVLIGEEEAGYEGMEVPNEGYDTTYKIGKKSGKKEVYVKFDDDVYYPMYKITFSILDEDSY